MVDRSDIVVSVNNVSYFIEDTASEDEIDTALTLEEEEINAFSMLVNGYEFGTYPTLDLGDKRAVDNTRSVLTNALAASGSDGLDAEQVQNVLFGRAPDSTRNSNNDVARTRELVSSNIAFNLTANNNVQSQTSLAINTINLLQQKTRQGDTDAEIIDWLADKISVTYDEYGRLKTDEFLRHFKTNSGEFAGVINEAIFQAKIR